MKLIEFCAVAGVGIGAYGLYRQLKGNSIANAATNGTLNTDQNGNITNGRNLGGVNNNIVDLQGNMMPDRFSLGDMWISTTDNGRRQLKADGYVYIDTLKTIATSPLTGKIIVVPNGTTHKLGYEISTSTSMERSGIYLDTDWQKQGSVYGDNGEDLPNTPWTWYIQKLANSAYGKELAANNLMATWAKNPYQIYEVKGDDQDHPNDTPCIGQIDGKGNLYVGGTSGISGVVDPLTMCMVSNGQPVYIFALNLWLKGGWGKYVLTAVSPKTVYTMYGDTVLNKIPVLTPVNGQVIVNGVSYIETENGTYIKTGTNNNTIVQNTTGTTVKNTTNQGQMNKVTNNNWGVTDHASTGIFTMNEAVFGARQTNVDNVSILNDSSKLFKRKNWVAKKHDFQIGGIDSEDTQAVSPLQGGIVFGTNNTEGMNLRIDNMNNESFVNNSKGFDGKNKRNFSKKNRSNINRNFINDTLNRTTYNRQLDQQERRNYINQLDSDTMDGHTMHDSILTHDIYVQSDPLATNSNNAIIETRNPSTATLDPFGIPYPQQNDSSLTGSLKFS